MEKQDRLFSYELGAPFIIVGSRPFPSGLMFCSKKLRRKVKSKESVLSKRELSDKEQDDYMQLLSEVWSELLVDIEESCNFGLKKRTVCMPAEFSFAMLVSCHLMLECMPFCSSQGKQFYLDVCFLAFSAALLHIADSDFSSGLALKYFVLMLQRLYFIGHTRDFFTFAENRTSSFKDIVMFKTDDTLDSVFSAYFSMAKYDLFVTEYKNDFVWDPSGIWYVADRCTKRRVPFPLTDIQDDIIFEFFKEKYVDCFCETLMPALELLNDNIRSGIVRDAKKLKTDFEFPLFAKQNSGKRANRDTDGDRPLIWPFAVLGMLLLAVLASIIVGKYKSSGAHHRHSSKTTKETTVFVFTPPTTKQQNK